jgi:hypothetical protein
LFSAIWKWTFSSSPARSAMSAPRVTRLRERRSSPGAGPQRAENVVEAQVAEFVGDAAVAQAGDIVWNAGQHLLEHVQTLNAGVSHRCLPFCKFQRSRDIW